MNAMNKVTMREMHEVQQTLGLAANELDQQPFKLQAAIVWVIKKRTDKDFTFDQAFDLTAEEVAETLGVETPLTQE